MKVVAGICGCIVLIFLVAWLLFLDLQSRIIALLLIAVVGAALGADSFLLPGSKTAEPD